LLSAAKFDDPRFTGFAVSLSSTGEIAQSFPIQTQTKPRVRCCTRIGRNLHPSGNRRLVFSGVVKCVSEVSGRKRWVNGQLRVQWCAPRYMPADCLGKRSSAFVPIREKGILLVRGHSVISSAAKLEAHGNDRECSMRLHSRNRVGLLKFFVLKARKVANLGQSSTADTNDEESTSVAAATPTSTAAVSATAGTAATTVTAPAIRAAPARQRQGHELRRPTLKC
jgi:hypothetical protein